MTILIVAFVLVAAIAFFAGFARNGPGEPSSVRLIALGAGLLALAVLLFVLKDPALQTLLTR